MRRTSTVLALRRPRCSWPSVASRRFICETARWTAARSWVGLVGSARSSSASGREGGRVLGALDQVALELAAQVALEAVELLAVDRRQLGAPSSAGGCVPAERPSVRRIRCTSTPTTPEPSPWRPKAAIASRARSRISPSLPSMIAWRICSRSSSRSSRSPPSWRSARSSMPALDRLGLGGAEEVALEEQLEDAPVLLRLGDRRRQRLAEVVAATVQRHLVEGGEGVEDLRGADRDPLAAQLLAEAEQLRAADGPVGPRVRPSGAVGARRQASPRPARRPGRCRCGA